MVFIVLCVSYGITLSVPLSFMYFIVCILFYEPCGIVGYGM